MVYSTYLGGSGDFGDAGRDIAVDGAGSAYVSGVTSSTDFPTTAGAVQTTYAGHFFDAFVTKLGSTGSALVYSTYLGGNFDDPPRRHRRGRRGQRLRDGLHGLDQFPDDRRGRPDDPPPAVQTHFVAKIEFGVPLPTSVDQCKNGGWKTFGVFKNQGDCVSFVASKGRNPSFRVVASRGGSCPRPEGS